MISKKHPSDLSVQHAAKAWTTKETSNIEMDIRLAFAFAEILDELWSKPWLGNATTAQLLEELTARAEIHGYADYKTTGEQKKL